MAIENGEAFKRIDLFFKTAMKYYGKRIGLNSAQHFGIQEINTVDEQQTDEHKYIIQYGFPQSGCVALHFTYSPESNSLTITKVSVYAPPKEKEFVVANLDPHIEVGAIGISAHFGIDSGT